MNKIARRQFLQLSAVAAAGCFIRSGADAKSQDLPKLTKNDPVAQALRYTHDASTVDPTSRAQAVADQTCANCAQLLGNDGDEWRPCQIFVGKLVNSNGWCSVWVPKT